MNEALWFILAGFDILGQYLMFSLLLPKKKVQLLRLLVCYGLQVTSYYLHGNSPAIFFTHLLCLLLLMQGYSGALRLKLVSLLIVYLLGMAAELTVYFFIMNRLGVIHVHIINIMTTLMLFAYYFLMRGILRKYQRPGTYLKAYFILLLGFLLTIGLSFGEGDWQENLPWIISMLLLCGLFVMEKLSDYRHVEQTRLNEAVYAVQLNGYEQQLRQMRESNQQLRQLRHDFRNHLLGLSGQSAAQQEQYVRELSAHYGIELEQSGFDFLEHFLRQKKQEANNRNLRMSYHKRYPTDSEIRDCDLIILLGNLLDNAMEAAEKTGDGFIECQVEYHAHSVRIRITNSTLPVRLVDGRPKNERGRERGIGLISVQRVVDAYGGCMQFSYDPPLLTVTAILFEPVNSVDEVTISA